ncbi:universal stress protein [Pseudidiomarina gelatinasegens]|uniref:Universal stress protein n=1 Tax=Pseudidiomarina gelatinasegens TaxID=2487740 RepID=A0A443YYQ4_9GAMM|nr:universal stress protein [Pseudidiomarina gelatinasegens]RWU09199.1 universal stress protein [Pseudidiomarina gelatinasegens]
MTNVVACIDGSKATAAVCDYAAWASLQLQAPLTLLHVLDQGRYPVNTDMTGNIGLGSREMLLDELAELDAQRNKLALQQGHHMLEAAQNRVRSNGAEQVTLRQRHGDLADTLTGMEADTRLFVLGIHGEDTSEPDSGKNHIGSHLETVLRSVHRPVLLTPENYSQPKSVLLAYDGSETTRKGVDMVAQSPLFRGLPIHVVMVDADTAANQEQLKWAKEKLEQHGHEVHVALLAGDVEPTLHSYQREHKLDVLVMGAYGHSRIRQFLVGSTTTNMLNNSDSPLLILR